MKDGGNGLRSVLKDKVFWFCAVSAALVLMIGTKSSFLYPLNDWVDSQCFYTVGKSMLFGKVPYRDLYEQKGPLLYMLHALGYLLSPGTFTGVYLLEVLCAAVFLYSTYRMLREDCAWFAAAVLPLLAALVYSAPSLSYGDSAEEFCLPMYACCMAVSVNALRKGENVGRGGMILAGAMGACVLWIKYTMLGFFVGWFLVPALSAACRRRWKDLAEMVCGVLFGVALVSLPILLYFALHGALGDLWQVYFHDNLTLYPDVDLEGAATLAGKARQILHTVAQSVSYTLQSNRQYSLLIWAGMIWAVLGERWSVKFHAVSMFALTCLTVYGAGRGYSYYGFILAAFAPLGLIPLARLAGWVSRRVRGERTAAAVTEKRCALILAAALCVLSVPITYRLSGNSWMLFQKKSETPQYRFAEIIREQEDATLLNYGFLDGGFYTAAGIVPHCRFFCYLNIPLDEVMDTQREMVREGRTDFVVTRAYPLNSPNYECVAQSSAYFAGRIYDYYLYRKK